MFKKFWDILPYIGVVISIMGTINSVYVRDLQHMCKGILFVIFWISMILEEKSPKKNKVVSIIYYVTSVIVVFLATVEIFFVFKF